jgi:DNA primase
MMPIAILISPMTAAPDGTTIERMTKKRTAGTVYLDYLQNGLSKTLPP